MLSAEQIVSNWDKFLKNISDNLSGERSEQLLQFYNKFDQRFSLMPASGKVSFHNAFAGGYVDHVNRVLKLSLDIFKLWQDSGASIDFTKEELAFVAINHDLGKFGDFEHEEYIDQDSSWHKERGEVYKHNPDISFMKTSERSLFILQQLGIVLSQNEYLGIKLHDGLYEEGNKGYYIAYSDEYRLRSNLPYIIHQADLLATRIEHDSIILNKNFNVKNTSVKTYSKHKGNPTTSIVNLPTSTPKTVTKKSNKYLSYLNKL